MLCVHTADDWTAAEIEWDDGVNPTETWTPASTVHSARDALDDLVAWLGTTFTDTPTETLTKNSGTARWDVSLALSGTYTVTPNSEAEELLGITSQGPTSTVTGASARGTVYPAAAPAVRRWWRDPTGQGRAAGNGVAMVGSPATAARRAALTVEGDAQEASALTLMLSVAASPRIVQVYDVYAATWREATLGATSRTRVAGKLWRHELEAWA